MKKIFLGMLLLSNLSFAGQFPIITSLNVEYRPDGANYYITQKLMQIGTISDSSMKNGWLGGLGHKHNYGSESSPHWIGSFTSAYGYAQTTQPVGPFMVDLYNRKGKDVSMVNHTGSNGFGECVGYMAGPQASGGRYTEWGQTMNPGGCMVVPPGDEWCKITTPELILDHGTISLKQAEGSTATTSLGLQCTVATAVTFNLVTQDKYVYLDEGKSEITVANQPLNTKIDLQQGDSQLSIKDLLTGITSEGFHTGSSVLVMMPY